MVHDSHVNAIVYDSKNGRLYSGDGVGAVVVWRMASGGRGGVDNYSVLRKARNIRTGVRVVPPCCVVQSLCDTLSDSIRNVFQRP